jgi:hypothetical protein
LRSNVHLARTEKLSRKAAMQKARKMKAEALKLCDELGFLRNLLKIPWQKGDI